LIGEKVITPDTGQGREESILILALVGAISFSGYRPAPV
jgi:hypothetical protein